MRKCRRVSNLKKLNTEREKVMHHLKLIFKMLKYICCIFFLTTFVYSGFSQTRSELERKRRENEKQIEYTNRLISETRESRETSLERLNIINQRIKLRNEMITSLNQEISILQQQINDQVENIKKLETKMEESRQNYARMVKSAYANKTNYNLLIHILSSQNLNQAYRRFIYIQQYSRERRNEIANIERLKSEIQDNLDENIKKKNELDLLSQEQRKEKILMENELRSRQNELSELKKREQELKNEFNRRRKISNDLSNEIEKLIAEERKRSEEAGYTEVSEYESLSENFKNNKGSLPWPTENGIITGHFGEHPHPVLSGITIQNNGIDILTDENAEVRSIFNGVVRRVVSIPGQSNAVIIRHGDFLTVYSNMNEVFVKPGQRVGQKEIIGRVYTDNIAGENAVLHLEIWEKDSKLDPAQWLIR